MAKLRVVSNFTTVPNTIVNSPDISFRAKGVFLFLQSKPDGWAFSANRIALSTSKEGRDAVISALQELEEYGFLRREKSKNKQGKWVWEYILYADRIADLPFTDNPSTDNPSTENTEIKKERYNNKDIIKKIDTSPSVELQDSSGTSATELRYEQEYTPRRNPKRVTEIASPPPKVPQKGSSHEDNELNKQVQLLENVFYRANPAYNFKNKSYKTACKDIIKAYGIEQAVRLAEGAIAIQSEKFAPRVGNPLQLRDKAIEVIGFASSKKKSSRVTFIR